MRQVLRVLGLWLLAVVVSVPAWAGEHDHIRVILDTSMSMRTTKSKPGVGNDPSKLAKLATLLLFDLAQPHDVVAGDSSYRVITFDLNSKKWDPPTGVPPAGVGPVIDVKAGGDDPSSQREYLERELAALEYDAPWTYFHPGMKQAVEELSTSGDPNYARRVIVVVTDGVPDFDEERPLLLDLVPDLEQHQIQLYILAFGPDSQDQGNQAFFRSLLAGKSRVLGHFEDSADGRDMLELMSQLFAKGFGYTYDGTFERSQVSEIRLLESLGTGGKHAAERAMVVAYHEGATAPGLDLSHPKRPVRSDPRGGLDAAGLSGFSYSMLRVLKPDGELYRFQRKSSAKVAVLRPTQLEVRLTPPAGTSGNIRVMAGQAIDLEAIVSPQGGGATAVPPDVDIKYALYAGHHTEGDPATTPFRDSTPPTLWERPGPGSNDTRVGVVPANFPWSPRSGESSYSGFIQLKIVKGAAETEVGGLFGKNSVPVDVYPPLLLTPESQGGYVESTGAHPRLLSPDRPGCLDFTFRLVIGQEVDGGPPRLPDLGRQDGKLNIQIHLDTKLPDNLKDASVTLSGPGLTGGSGHKGGVPLEPTGPSTSALARWSGGVDIDQAALLDGPYTVCVEPTHPYRTSAVPGATNLPDHGELQLDFTLAEQPYDSLAVINPLTVKYQLEPESLASRLTDPCCILASLATLLALLWIGRYRPDLPWDLHASVAVETDPSLARATAGPPSFSAVDLGLPGVWERLGFVGPRDLSAGPGGPLLGEVTPIDKQIYRFAAGPSVRELLPLEGTEEDAPERLPVDGPVELEVHRTYLALTDQGRFRFRLEYRR